MSERRFPSQPDDLLRRWGTQVVPVDEPERIELRRAQVVSALSRSIRENAEHKRRARRARWVTSVSLAAALALGFAAHFRKSTESKQSLTTVAEVQGAVVVTEAGQSSVLAQGSSRALHALGEIETAPDARAEIRSQKSLVHLSPATKLTVPQATSVEERYRLALGRVDVSVDKNSELSRSVVVETPDAEVVVHGTVFAVGVSSRAEHTVTEVSVTRGSVWVLVHGGEVAVLGPGQHWSSENQLAIAPPTPAGGRAPESGAAPDLEPVPGSSSSSSSVHGARHAPAPAESKSSTLLEQERLFQDAIDARNRGDDAHAADLFGRLVARYPGYEEAEVQLFRAQKRLGQTAAAAASARRYLAEHPQGFAHEEARSLALSSSAR